MSCHKRLLSLSLLALASVSAVSAETAGRNAEPKNCVEAAASIKPDPMLPLDEQERRLRKIVQVCPELAEGYANLGSVLTKRGAFQEAKQSFEKAFSIHENAAFVVGLAAVAVAANDLGEAETQYQRALLLDGNSSQALQGLAYVHIAKDSLQEAERLLRRAAQLTPEDPVLFYNFAVVLGRQGKLAESIASLRAALERKPDYAEARQHLARALLKENRYDEAEALLRARLDEDNSDVLAAVMLATVLEARGQLKPAEKILSGLESRSPDRAKHDPSVRLARAILRIKRGKIRDGINMLEQLEKSGTKTPRLESALGWAYLQQGDVVRSVDLLKKALHENPEDQLARINLEVADSLAQRR